MYHGYTGLINLGNTCYMNSIIQVLSNNTDMSRYYIGFSHALNSKTKNLFKNYQMLITEMWKGNNIIKPISFKNSVNMLLKNQKYNNVEQHDAHEFLLDILDIIHENSRVEKINDPNCSSEACSRAAREWSNTLRNTESFITREFYGQYKIKYECSICLYKFYKFDVFSCMYLDFPTRKKECDIQELINHHFLTDYVTLTCEKCHCSSEHTVSKKIFKMPRVLVIVLKRYTTSSFKNSVILKNIENMNIKNYGTYNLNSVVCNNGNTLQSGHYYSIISRDNRYTLHDDHKITQIESIKPSSDAYIIFYSQKKNNKGSNECVYNRQVSRN